jgi:hypothetical protein
MEPTLNSAAVITIPSSPVNDKGLWLPKAADEPRR